MHIVRVSDRRHTFQPEQSTWKPAFLQMGMGKTAFAIGAIQMNPPPAGWRANRAGCSRRVRDHLGERDNRTALCPLGRCRSPGTTAKLAALGQAVQAGMRCVTMPGASSSVLYWCPSALQPPW